MNTSVRVALAMSLLGTLGLGGCAPILMAGVATTGVVLAQERSVGDTLDDAAVQLELRQRLYNASHNAFTGVDLEVVEGRVLMTGRVNDQETRIEASRIAWTTPGVDDVINEVAISEQRFGYIRPRDAWITTQLRTRLIADTSVRQVNYHIETLRGTVYLFGVAQNQDELSHVTQVAEAIGGVDRVVSHMRMKDDPFAQPAIQPYAAEPATDPYASGWDTSSDWDGEPYANQPAVELDGASSADPYMDPYVDPYAQSYSPPPASSRGQPITQPVVGEPLALPAADPEPGA